MADLDDLHEDWKAAVHLFAEQTKLKYPDMMNDEESLQKFCNFVARTPEMLKVALATCGLHTETVEKSRKNPPGRQR